MTESWMAQLDVGVLRALTTSSPGVVVVAGDQAAISYSASGAKQWRIARSFLDARTLPDGRTILRTGERVQIVDCLGETLMAWAQAGLWAPQPLGDDRLIDLDSHGVLTCWTYDGTLLWRVELGCRSLYPPTIVGSEIIVSDRSGLARYDQQGQLRDRIDIGGKHEVDPLAAAEAKILAWRGSYLAPIRNARDGSSWYRWEPKTALTRFAAGAALNGPACISGDLFVAASPDFSDTGQQFLRAFTASNERVWELALPRIVAVAAVANSRIAVVSSPTAQRWENYRALQPVEDDCRVTIVDPAGAVVDTYAARAPLAGLVEHAGGLVYTVKQATLVALAE